MSTLLTAIFGVLDSFESARGDLNLSQVPSLSDPSPSEQTWQKTNLV